MRNNCNYVVEMLHITKEFPGIKANDDITLQLRLGEIHALLGENGAGKSTLMSVLFGLYQPDEGEIRINGNPVKINNPNDATALHIGMVHQHFKLVDVFTVLDNIILGAEDTVAGFLSKKKARKKVTDLSRRYGLNVNLDAKIEDITVGMQQRVEILKMLYRDNEVLIFDEPTAVLTPQEIEELMKIMKGLAAEGKSILFITHKLNEIMAVSDRCTVLRKGKYIGTVETKNTNQAELSRMMVGRDVQLVVEKEPAKPSQPILEVTNLCVKSKMYNRDAVKNVSFKAYAGEIVCIAGIDGNGQTELVHAITGLEKTSEGKVLLYGRDPAVVKKSYKVHTKKRNKVSTKKRKNALVIQGLDKLKKSKAFSEFCEFRNKLKKSKIFSDFSEFRKKRNRKRLDRIPNITSATIRRRSLIGMSHIPEDRHKHGLILDNTLEQNMVLQKYYEPRFQKKGFIRFGEVRKYANKLIEQYDVRSGQGPITVTRSMSGGNQQKAIIAREIDRDLPLIVAVQPTRGLDVGAIEYIHGQLIKARDAGKAVLLVSLELDEVMNLSDRILVMYEGEIVGELDPKQTTVEELGLYMAGAKKKEGGATA